MVCSFVYPIQPQTLRSATLELARPINRVLLGVSRDRADVITMLRDGPVHFLALTASTELPYLIASEIYELAEAGKSSFDVRESEISDTIGFFVECVFGSQSTNRIGAAYSSNFQKLVYNVAACTLSKYESLTRNLKPDVLEKKIESLRR